MSTGLLLDLRLFGLRDALDLLGEPILGSSFFLKMLIPLVRKRKSQWRCEQVPVWKVLVQTTNPKCEPTLQRLFFHRDALNREHSWGLLQGPHHPTSKSSKEDWAKLGTKRV